MKSSVCSPSAPAEPANDIRHDLALLREERIRLSRATFWEFCKTLHGDFYADDRPHLKLLCDTLQGLNEGTLLKPDGSPYKKLIINMPPRHGKTRTLVLFSMWVFGKKKRTRIIATSYNDDLAQDFSRYTRDGISEEKLFPHEIVYADIFPETRVSQGNASFQKWALEGEFFSYKGAGIGGSITGKGGDITIIDDPVKSVEEAYSDTALQRVWDWYTGTFLSRKEEGGLEIINMTRWAKKDLCGLVLKKDGDDKWFILKMEVKDRVTGEMLCPPLMSSESYEDKRSLMDPAIFLANYHQEPVDIEGTLYKELKTYTEKPEFEYIDAYIDVADKGTDWFCGLVYGVFRGEAWILDVLYTKAGMEVTEPATADMLFHNNVRDCVNESNNGGRSFSRAVERILWERHQTRRVTFHPFHQSRNKLSRILSQSTFVMGHIYFPHNWKDRWPDFHEAVTTFQREGKNENDDAPDALTGVAERVNNFKLPEDEKKKTTSKAALGLR